MLLFKLRSANSY